MATSGPCASHSSNASVQNNQALELLQNNAPNADDFIKIWPTIEKVITVEDILIPIENGPYRGKSTLWLLINRAETYQREEPFLLVFNRFQYQLRLQDFLTENADMSPCAFWILASSRPKENKKPLFELIWNRYRQQMTLQHLRTKVGSGRHQGVSVFHLLAKSTTHNEIFLQVLDQFQDQLSLEDFLQSAANRSNALWFLAKRVQTQPEAFNIVFDKFQRDMKLTNLLTTVEDEKAEGCALWQLALATYRGNHQAFLKVFERFKDEITWQHISSAPTEGFYQNVSVFTCLVAGFFFRETEEPFLQIFDKFQDQIKLQDLLTKTPFYHTACVLWLLAYILNSGKSSAFLRVFEKFKSQLIFEHLLITAEDDESKTTIFFMLIARYSENRALIKEIFGHLPGKLPETCINTKGETKALRDILTDTELTSLIDARNALYKKFDECEKSTIEHHDVEALFHLAEQALNTGYVNAFFDLGNILRLHNLIPQAFKAYSRIDSTSLHYSLAQLWVAEHYFGLSLSLNNNEEKKQRKLGKALFHALKTHEKDKEALIEKIAASYMKRGCMSATNLVPKGWFASKKYPIDIDWCLRKLDKLEIKVKQEEKVQSLVEKVASLTTALEKLTVETRALTKAQAERNSVAVPGLRFSVSSNIAPLSRAHEIFHDLIQEGLPLRIG